MMVGQKSSQPTHTTEVKHVVLDHLRWRHESQRVRQYTDLWKTQAKLINTLIVLAIFSFTYASHGQPYQRSRERVLRKIAENVVFDATYVVDVHE